MTKNIHVLLFRALLLPWCVMQKGLCKIPGWFVWPAQPVVSMDHPHPHSIAKPNNDVLIDLGPPPRHTPCYTVYLRGVKMLCDSKYGILTNQVARTPRYPPTECPTLAFCHEFLHLFCRQSLLSRLPMAHVSGIRQLFFVRSSILFFYFT